MPRCSISLLERKQRNRTETEDHENGDGSRWEHWLDQREVTNAKGRRGEVKEFCLGRKGKRGELQLRELVELEHVRFFVEDLFGHKPARGNRRICPGRIFLYIRINNNICAIIICVCLAVWIARVLSLPSEEARAIASKYTHERRNCTQHAVMFTHPPKYQFPLCETESCG